MVNLVLELLRFRLVASLAARYRALIGARPRRDGSSLAEPRVPRRRSHMTARDIETIVRALTAVAENLEAGAARQSMRDALMQVRAYARDPTWASAERQRSRRA